MTKVYSVRPRLVMSLWLIISYLMEKAMADYRAQQHTPPEPPGPYQPPHTPQEPLHDPPKPQREPETPPEEPEEEDPGALAPPGTRSKRG